MKTPKLYIHLDQRIPSFFPGQTIVGQVVLNNDKPKELKSRWKLYTCKFKCV